MLFPFELARVCVLISVSVARTAPDIVENYPKEFDYYCSLVVDKKAVLHSPRMVVV